MSSDSGDAPSRGLPREPVVIYEKKSRAVRRRELNAFARSVCRRVAGDRPFCCLLTGDEALQRLNLQFRGIDAPTDVLSFPRATSKGELGDIAISVDRARSQAATYGHDLTTEIQILMLHGVLHLLGLDHHSSRSKMRRIESLWRYHLGLPEGLIDRTLGGKPAPRRIAPKPASGGRAR